MLRAQARQGGGVLLDVVGEPATGAVLLADNEQRRLSEHRRAVAGGIVPVLIHAPVTVQRRGESGPLEFRDGPLEVLAAQPAWRLVATELIAHRAAARDQEPGRGAGRGAARGQRGVEAGEPAAHVRLDLGLGPAGLLEVGDVELGVAGHRRERLTRANRPPRRVRHAQQPDRGEHLRMQQRRGRRNR